MFGFPGVLDQPFSGGDYDLDGVDDIGVVTPNQNGNAAELEWYLLQSGGDGFPGLADGFSPSPLGSDLFTVFGNNLAAPIAGNFDPPIDGNGNTAPVLMSIGNRIMSPKAGSLSIPLRSTDADANPVTYTAVIHADGVINQAFNLDQQYDFQLFPGSLVNDHYFDSRGLQERYLPGFVIMPGGELYRWGGSIESSTQVATLDARYHANPSLLVDVSDPAGAADIPAISINTQIVGNTLTLFPPVDYLGSFNVTITVTDSIASDSETFTVTVENSTPVLSPIGNQSLSTGDTL